MLFRSHLADLAANSQQLAQRRADHIVAMEAFNAQLDAALQRELYMQQHARSGSEWNEMKSLMDELAALRDDLLRIAQSARTLQADRRKELLAAQTSLETYKKALRDAAAALGALAHVQSDSESAKFVGTYSRDVRDEVKKALDADNKTAKAANALIDAAQSEIKGVNGGAASADSNP